MFVFGFSDESDEENEEANKRILSTYEKKYREISTVSYEEILSHSLDGEYQFIDYHISDGYSLKCVSVVVSEILSKDNCDLPSNAINSIINNSDLIPNVYEGGFKIWDGSIDMINYLIEHKYLFEDKSVLELGCGSGLPGMHVLLNGAKEVHFQDYNKDVLKKLTIPNVEFNLMDRGFKLDNNYWQKPGHKDLKVRYFSGSWNNFVDNFSFKYDAIISSETIYCKDNYKTLQQIFSKFLKPEGICIIAAKTYYFGVGGGTREFEQYVMEENVFNIEAKTVSIEGVQREILVMKFKI